MKVIDLKIGSFYINKETNIIFKVASINLISEGTILIEFKIKRPIERTYTNKYHKEYENPEVVIIEHDDELVELLIGYSHEK